ncbi:kinase-like domain-containing protein [Mycena olivaceomarginata]|nr:kinase-like domain-containing protein [Mycena olivaceomarginata]
MQTMWCGRVFLSLKLGSIAGSQSSFNRHLRARDSSMAHSIGAALTTAISEDDTVRILCQPSISSPAPVATISSHLVHSRKGILDCIEKEWMDSLKIPQNFILYVFSLILRPSQGQITKIRDLMQEWVRWDALQSLANYRCAMETLFDVLKTMPDWPKSSHAENIYQCLSQDVHVLHDQLLSIFQDPETYRNFLACRGDLAQKLVDLLQDVLDSLPELSSSSRLSKALMRLSRASGVHPTCFPLTNVQIEGDQVAAGAFGDIRKGLARGQTVAVKTVRLFQDNEVRAAAQMLDVAMGVEYLHGKHVVHGDLKGMNILVTPSRRACVADFGLSSIADSVTLKFTHLTPSPRGGTSRYQAPELLLTAMPNHFGSDVYAFACIWTGKAPFFEFPRDITVAIKVLEGLRPSRPETMPIDNNLWSLLQDCWKEEFRDRPNASQIIRLFVGPAIRAKPTDAAVDWDETISSKSRRSLQDWPLLPSIATIENRLGDHRRGRTIQAQPHASDYQHVAPPYALHMPVVPRARPGRIISNVCNVVNLYSVPVTGALARSSRSSPLSLGDAIDILLIYCPHAILTS